MLTGLRLDTLVIHSGFIPRGLGRTLGVQAWVLCGFYSDRTVLPVSCKSNIILF